MDIEDDFRRRRMEENAQRDSTAEAVRTRIEKGVPGEELSPRDESFGVPLSDEEFRLWITWLQDGIKKGWKEGALLIEWLTGRIAVRRMGMIEAKNIGAYARSKDLQTARKEAFARILAAEKQLTYEAEKKQEESDAITLLDRYRENARKFIESHAGEFAFTVELECPRCHTPCKETVSTDGLPWWACTWEKDKDGEIIYLKWSSTLLWLYNHGQITLAQAAFILGTSPKGLLYTAKRRHEKMRECDEMAEEAALKKLRMESDWPRIQCEPVE